MTSMRHRDLGAEAVETFFFGMALGLFLGVIGLFFTAPGWVVLLFAGLEFLAGVGQSKAGQRRRREGAA